jgi:NADPH:quinone reductase-like Zn-dependent oxidoreductase
MDLMKAIVYHRYGSPDVLQCEEIEKPAAGNNEVLIRVRAASVNPLDWHFMRGTPYMLRLAAGLRKPKVTRLGVDVAGQVEAVGKDVTQFKPGDEVFGSCRGAFAEYVCTSEPALVLKPDSVTFEQAAAVPVAAFTALQGLRDKGRIQPGQAVLINGAAGGVGTLAVQIAKSFGAHVTGVCSTRNVDLVRSIGADRVIDYTQQDFTTSGPSYDIILDCVGNHSLSACRRILNPQGSYIEIAGSADRWMFGGLARMFAMPVLSWFVSQTLVTLLARRSKEDLTTMRELMQAGKVTPVIDRSYPLSQVPEAIRYLEEGHARGKVVITFEHNDKT